VSGEDGFFLRDLERVTAICEAAMLRPDEAEGASSSSGEVLGERGAEEEVVTAVDSRVLRCSDITCLSSSMDNTPKIEYIKISPRNNKHATEKQNHLRFCPWR